MLTRDAQGRRVAALARVDVLDLAEGLDPLAGPVAEVEGQLARREGEAAAAYAEGRRVRREAARRVHAEQLGRVGRLSRLDDDGGAEGLARPAGRLGREGDPKGAGLGEAVTDDPGALDPRVERARRAAVAQVELNALEVTLKGERQGNVEGSHALLGGGREAERHALARPGGGRERDRR